MNNSVRIDKWLWAVRLFKTRSQAAEACKKGKITVNNQTVKPSREIVAGDTVFIRQQPINRTYKVLEIAGKRMGAKLTVDFVKEITPQEELDILETQKHMRWITREKGTGRPTKKERRDMDDFFNL